MNKESLEYIARMERASGHMQPGEVDRLDMGGLYRKAAVDAFYARVTNQVYAIKLGDNGLLQAVRSEVKNFKPYRIPRAWGVWLE